MTSTAMSMVGVVITCVHHRTAGGCGCVSGGTVYCSACGRACLHGGRREAMTVDIRYPSQAQARVWLNGEEVTRWCVYADDQAGLVKLYKHNRSEERRVGNES